jgi:cerevisin
VTVAASDEADGRAYFSNYGAGVDIFAPGSAIRSASALSDSGFRTLSGTSMAAPLVSGVAASLWSACPSCSKDDILKQLLDTYATEGVLTGIPAGTPNKLVFSRFA